MSLNILARRPRNFTAELILVDRGDGSLSRFVVGTATASTLEQDEWFWGHYFHTLEAAVEYFIEAAGVDNYLKEQAAS